MPNSPYEIGSYESTISAIVDHLSLRVIHYIIQDAENPFMAAQHLHVDISFLQTYLRERDLSFKYLQMHSPEEVRRLCPYDYDKRITPPQPTVYIPPATILKKMPDTTTASLTSHSLFPPPTQSNRDKYKQLRIQVPPQWRSLI